MGNLYKLKKYPRQDVNQIEIIAIIASKDYTM